MVTYIIDLQNI